MLTSFWEARNHCGMLGHNGKKKTNDENSFLENYCWAALEQGIQRLAGWAGQNKMLGWFPRLSNTNK